MASIHYHVSLQQVSERNDDCFTLSSESHASSAFGQLQPEATWEWHSGDHSSQPLSG